MKCGCVFVWIRPRGREGEEDRDLDGIVAWKYESLHGSPLGKNEFAPQSQLFLSLWAWAENGEGKRKFFGL